MAIMSVLVPELKGSAAFFYSHFMMLLRHPSSAVLLIVKAFGLLPLLGIVIDIYYFYRDPFNLRRFPAPSCAVSNLWSAYHSHPKAVQAIYGHGSPIVKSIFYKTISGGDAESLVSTLDKDEHARKRRNISNAFAQRNIVSMEPLVAERVRRLVDRLDRAAEMDETIDIRQWLNYFTFDVISAMALGNDPGLLLSGEDKTTGETVDGRTFSLTPIQAFQSSTVHVASLGHWPEWLHITKPLTKLWPNSKSGDNFEAMCVHQIRKRLQRPKIVSDDNLPYGDFFQHLMVNKTGQDRSLPFRELVQEVAVYLSAGSDTAASAMTNTLFLLIKHPHCLEKIRHESGKLSKTDGPTIPYAQATQLKYLRACIDEGLRHLTPTSVGLQRMTPPEGAEIAGNWITGGITVSVPTYTMHHNPDLFPDPFIFKPERWLDANAEERRNLKDYFIPFTLGRHSCIGRNIAYLEQYVVLSTLVNRYDFSFVQPDFELPVLERINANPGPMPVKVKRRYNFFS